MGVILRVNTPIASTAISGKAQPQNPASSLALIQAIKRPLPLFEQYLLHAIPF